MFQAFLRNVGTCHFDAKGDSQVANNFETQSTKAKYRDGVARISDETAVMAVERRGYIIQLYFEVTQRSLVGAIKYGKVI